MKKILYLHGLESQQGGKKEAFLSLNNFVWAPEVDYYKKDALWNLIQKVEKFKPDLIIGSSMGGYFAENIAKMTNIEVLLLNPAHSWDVQEGYYIRVRSRKIGYKRTIVLGLQDDIVDPLITKKMFNGRANIIELEGIGHRIPFLNFVDIYNKYLLNEVTTNPK